MNDNSSNTDRNSRVIRVSIVGIIVNIILAVFKALTGVLTRSIAITLDAVNNLSDALSSVITILGTLYAKKAPDKEHPLGHGRAEYLSASVISLIILYAGITSFIESVKKIIHPEVPEYGKWSVILLVVAVITKILLGLYTEHSGKKYNSDSLIASGKDAITDAYISIATILAAIIFIIWNISIEAFLGLFIAFIIIKSGVELLKGTLSEILGERISPELSQNIKNALIENENVIGAYDLLLHNYGPDKFYGSVHVEVKDTLNADQIDDLSRELTHKIYDRYGVILEAIGIYAINTDDPVVAEMQLDIMNTIHSHDYILQTHGFHVDFDPKTIYVDVIIDFAAPNRTELYEHIRDEIQGKYPDFNLKMVLDVDVSD